MLIPFIAMHSLPLFSIYIFLIQLDFNQTQLRQLADAVSKMNSSLDVSQFVTSNVSTVHYPPPKPQFQLPENNSTKLVSIIITHTVM